jgi:hypothetical protein
MVCGSWRGEYGDAVMVVVVVVAVSWRGRAGEVWW